jgi:hypothetical protein
MNDFDLLRPAARQRTSNGRRRPGRRRIACTLTSNLFMFASCLAGDPSHADSHSRSRHHPAQHVELSRAQVNLLNVPLVTRVLHSKFRWPRRRYGVVVETADEVARLAEECAIIRQAVALATWVRPEGGLPWCRRGSLLRGQPQQFEQPGVLCATGPAQPQPLPDPQPRGTRYRRKAERIAPAQTEAIDSTVPLTMRHVSFPSRPVFGDVGRAPGHEDEDAGLSSYSRRCRLRRQHGVKIGWPLADVAGTWYVAEAVLQSDAGSLPRGHASLP